MIKSEKAKKIICFLIPNLLYLALILYFYCNTYTPYGDSFEIFYREVLLFSLGYFIVFSLVYLILRKLFKLDYYNVFFIELSLILMTFYIAYSEPIIWILVILFNIFIFKRSEDTKIKFCFFISFVVLILFQLNFIESTGYVLKNMSRFEDKDIVYTTKVDNNLKTPNIYWIHCDGMLNLDDVNKYFEYDYSEFKKYLDDNKFIVNSDASFYSTGHTLQSLAALYNPKYYDMVLKEYFDNVNNDNFNDKIITFDKLTDKRLNNELFASLKEKDYKLVSITEFNHYSAFYTDYIFDYYNFQHSKEQDLDYMTSEDFSYDEFMKFIYYSHFKTLGDVTFTHYFTDNYNFLKHKEIDYNKFDFSKCPSIDKGDYWKAKAMIASLDMMYKKDIDNSLFTFIDFELNHTPWVLDENGKKVNTNKEGFSLENYVANYEYSTKVLSEMIDFIKSNDQNAIIILQADHGIHTVTARKVKKYFDGSSDDVNTLRNSTFSAIYIPEEYINGDEKYLENPLNISRYLVNNFVGENYTYVE